MNLEETLKLLQALKANGATHFKSSDFEVTLIGGLPVLEVPAAQSLSPAEAPVAPPPYDQEATEKVQELIDTLKLNDEALVNKIFPDGAI
jgi:hypothetical protein